MPVGALRALDLRRKLLGLAKVNLFEAWSTVPHCRGCNAPIICFVEKDGPRGNREIVRGPVFACILFRVNNRQGPSND